MSLRTTLFLVVLAVAAGVVAYVNPFKKEAPAAPAAPWFYQVSMDDIQSIEVTHGDRHVRFFRNEEGAWEFEDPPGVPPAPERWGGMTLLLSGPRTRRLVSDTVDDPAQYGLDKPASVFYVTLTGNREIRVQLGNESPDQLRHYGQVVGFPQLYLIEDAWGDVLTRLATEPPYPRWYVKRAVSRIVGLTVFGRGGDVGSQPQVEFKLGDDGAWYVASDDEQGADVPVDPARWQSVLPLVVGPPLPTVAKHNVGDAGAPFGLSDTGPAIQVHYKDVTQRGTEFTASVTFRVGDKAPGGEAYYGQDWYSDYPGEPVILLDAAWVETLLGLLDDIPYAEPTPAP